MNEGSKAANGKAELSKPARLRLFVALPLPEMAEAALIEAQAGLKQRARHSTLEPRWQKPEQLHITLKFLGYVEAERLPELEQTLSAEAHASHPIKTYWAGLHAFASPSRARVVIARLSDPRAELLALYTRLEASLSSLGFPLSERAFTPHVTIARIETAGDVRSWLSLPLPEMKFDLGCLRLYRSELRRGGAQYHVLAETLLGGG